MNNDYELNRHKKSDAVKWIVAFALIAVLLIGMSASIILAANNGKDNPSGKDESTEETIADATDDEIYPMPRAMSFTANTLAAALAEGQTVDVKIKAIVSPYDAANQFVDYSVAWGSAPEHGDEPVTDYVTVTPDSDGSATATVSCKQAFGADKIVVTVTTRDGGFTANCTVSFIGMASGMSVTSSAVTPVSDDNRGTYYQLGTSRTYTFDVNLDNAFHEVGSKNLSVSVGGGGSLYFGKTYTDSMSGIARFQDMELRKLSAMADRFITSAAISGTTLTVQTGSKLVENYYSYYESDEYFTGSYTYDRYVYEDEFGLTVGDKISDDYEGKAKSNTAALPSCYFTITVTDTVSGLSESLRLWLVSSVSGVRFEKSELSF